MGEIIQHHLEVHQIKNLSAEKWGAGLLFINWKYILQIWRERCDDIHGKTAEQIEKSSKARLLEEIRYIQSINRDLVNSEYSWILENIENVSEYNSRMLST
jgi:hypothetical protein